MIIRKIEGEQAELQYYGNEERIFRRHKSDLKHFRLPDDKWLVDKLDEYQLYLATEEGTPATQPRRKRTRKDSTLVSELGGARPPTQVSRRRRSKAKVRGA